MTRPHDRLDGTSRRARIVVAGSAAAIAVGILAAGADFASHGSPASTAIDVVVGFVFIGGASVAAGPWRTRALFGAVGFTWLAGSFLTGAQIAYAGVLAVALVTFPGGRPSSVRRWLVVALSVV
ncbi:MAG TPA: hypothetical protein VIH37_05970, partial [Candidatus Limnocylindrales bacterium]